MFKTRLTIIILALTFQYNSQEIKEISTIKKNTIFLEAGGQSLFYSLNYDRLFRIHKKIQNNFELGLSIIPKNKNSDYVISTPVSCNFLIGKSNNKLEIGIGLTAMFVRKFSYSQPDYDDPFGNKYIHFYEKNEKSIYFSPKIGYRFQKADGGFFFKAMVTPIIPFTFSSFIKERNVDVQTIFVPYYYSKRQQTSFTKGDFYSWLGFSLGYTF